MSIQISDADLRQAQIPELFDGTGGMVLYAAKASAIFSSFFADQGYSISGASGVFLNDDGDASSMTCSGGTLSSLFDGTGGSVVQAQTAFSANSSGTTGNDFMSFFNMQGYTLSGSSGIFVNTDGVVAEAIGPDGANTDGNFLTTTGSGETFLDSGFSGSSFLASPIVTNSTPTTGTTVSAGTAKKDELLYITPAGTLLALTVTLPAAANCRVSQIVRGFISQIITTLTVNQAGSGTVVGSTPVTSSTNAFFAYECVSVAGNGTWARIT